MDPTIISKSRRTHQMRMHEAHIPYAGRHVHMQMAAVERGSTEGGVLRNARTPRPPPLKSIGSYRVFHEKA